MKLKELAQGCTQLMADGLAESDVTALLADGTTHPLLKLVVDKGVQEVEPEQVNPPPIPQLIIG